MYEREIKSLRFLQDYGDQLVADVKPNDFCRQPLAGMNHPAWILGHLAYAADGHATYVGSRARLGDWAERFGFGSELSTDTSMYPHKNELLRVWRDANDRYISAVSQASPEDLTQPTKGPIGEAFPTVGEFLTFSLTGHVSLHLGQLSAWRRACGMPRLF